MGLITKRIPGWLGAWFCMPSAALFNRSGSDRQKNQDGAGANGRDGDQIPRNHRAFASEVVRRKSNWSGNTLQSGNDAGLGLHPD
jgi:hypothetical protein